MFFRVHRGKAHKLIRRCFSISNLENENSFLQIKNKKEIIVLHPVINNGKRGKKKKREEVIWDAQEALGLARSANFSISKGISMPAGGWNTKIKKNEQNENHCGKKRKSDETEETNKPVYSCEEKNFKNTSITEIERKIAESIIIKAHGIDNQFYFGKGKLNDIGKYYLKNPTPYIFINTLLSPEQLKNLDLFFNSLLKGYQNDLISENDKMKYIKREMINESTREKEKSYFSETQERKEGKAEGEEKEEEGEEKEEKEEEGEEKEKEEISIVEEEEKAGQAIFHLYNTAMDVDKTEMNDKMYWKEGQEEREETLDIDWYEWKEPAVVDETKTDDQYGIYENRAKRRNIPLYVEIFDRHSIILHIFKKRANSNITKLQVEIARAKFILNNYAEDNKSRVKYFKYVQNNVLSKSYSDYEDECNDTNTFGINKKGKQQLPLSNYTSNFIKSSETYKEYEKRIINNLFNKLKKELEKCKRNRNLQNKSRNHKASIVVVGYTNVGKTMLINYLTKSNLKTRNVLFQTLDNAYKNLPIANSYSTILVDSIGFIQNIPYSLLEAFKASLEAIKNADIIIHVIDITHPYNEEQKKCVLDTLQNIGISKQFIENNVIEVWNKIDNLSEKEMLQLLKKKPKNALPISAYDGTNCEVLIQIIQNLINTMKNVQVITLQFDTKEAQKRIEFLSKHFKVVKNSIRYSDDGNITFIQLVENPQNLKKYYEKFDS